MLFVLLFVFAVISADGASYEGDRCDANGVSGVCRNLRDCPSALEDLKNNKPLPLTCGCQNKDVIVCCTNEPTSTLTTTKRPAATTTTEYIPEGYEVYDYEFEGNGRCEPIPPIMTAKPTGQKAWDKCIEYQEKYVFPCEKSFALNGEQGRVNRCHHSVDELIAGELLPISGSQIITLGGIDVAQYEFPHMVLLGYQNDQKKIDWLCGGALISEKFVLSAGHCILNTLGNNVSHALIGILRQSEENASNRYGIKRIIKHDKFQRPRKYNDIALLELDRNVPLSHTLVPACLHTPQDNVDESRATATSWSATIYKFNNTPISNSDKLQKVILTKFPSNECSSKYAPNRNLLLGVDENTQVCYGDRTLPEGTCLGDSGPLQVKNKRIVCMYTIVGVASLGKECGFVDIPSVYTKISAYLPWIERIVWPN